MRIGTCLLKFLFFILIMQAFLACTEDNKLSQENTSPTKISSNLLRVMNYLDSDSSSKQGKGLTHNTRTARIDKEGKIQIYIILYQIDDIILEDLKKNGVKVDIYDSEQKLVQGWAKPEKIKTISEFSYVKFIDLPTYGVSN
ncbi:MAG: hypothetical protein WBD99_14690 [Thermodesulfobacteriota bacterium]